MTIGGTMSEDREYTVRYIQYYTPRRRRSAGRCYDRTCGAPDCPLCYPCGGEETTEEGEG
jgi:hypothetical protein